MRKQVKMEKVKVDNKYKNIWRKEELCKLNKFETSSYSICKHSMSKPQGFKPMQQGGKKCKVKFTGKTTIIRYIVEIV